MMRRIPSCPAARGAALRVACTVGGRALCGCGGKLSVLEGARRYLSRQRSRAREPGRVDDAPTTTIRTTSSSSSHGEHPLQDTGAAVPSKKQQRMKIIKADRLMGLAAATSSPWVWGLQGMDMETVLPSPAARTRARAIFSAKPLFLEPSSLNYELPKAQQAEHTEVAVLGRSNVGKSSLIAALLGGGTAASKLVRTSKTPGCTRTLNFYRFEGQPLFLVDLPGYGFARAPESRRDEWMEVVQSYLEGRGMHLLRRTLLLVDARHGLRPMDQEVMQVFDQHAVPYQIVLTKVDALRGGEQARQEVVGQVTEVACRQRACLPIIHLTSAKEGVGMQELQDALAALVLAQ